MTFNSFSISMDAKIIVGLLMTLTIVSARWPLRIEPHESHSNRAFPARAGADLVERIDRDGDGRINRTESLLRFGGSSSKWGWDMLEKHFIKMDQDKDGFLSAKELDAAPATYGDKAFVRL